MPSAQIIQLSDYLPKQKPAAERMNDALRRWQTAAWVMDPGGTLQACCDFYAALYEDSAAAIGDQEDATNCSQEK